MVDGPGWRRIGPDPRIAAWAAAALPVAQAALAASAEPWRCGGTWFVGVDALPNGSDGAVGGGAFPWAALPLAPQPLHRAQLSVVRPGYPQPWEGEDAAAFGFRLRRDAAHLDGLLPVGPQKRRMVKEPHAWILGLPLNEGSAGASPLVVWEDSHRLMRAALAAAFAAHPPDTWGAVDVTEAYKAARAEVFRRCRRVDLPARPGEATLLHRLTIHGVAPWAEGAEAPPEGRIVAYFRPLMARVSDWIAPD
ncbi:MAG: hypothetical protein KBF78_06485 [Fuscovulum sp.]|nr:hypothetical protein [Fuscovulum sp.]